MSDHAPTTPDLPGPHIRSAFAALDELIALANHPDTAEQVCAERVLIGTLLARAMLLASFVQPPVHFQSFKKKGKANVS